MCVLVHFSYGEIFTTLLTELSQDRMYPLHIAVSLQISYGFVIKSCLFEQRENSDAARLIKT